MSAERIVANDGDAGRGRLADIEADVDYFNRQADRLRIAGGRRRAAIAREHLNSAVGAIADIDVPVVGEDDAMRMTAAGGSERPGRTRLIPRRVCTGRELRVVGVFARRAPLAIVGVGFSSISSGVDDDAVVTVTVGNVDASPRAGERIR